MTKSKLVIGSFMVLLSLIILYLSITRISIKEPALLEIDMQNLKEVVIRNGTSGETQVIEDSQ